MPDEILSSSGPAASGSVVSDGTQAARKRTGRRKRPGYKKTPLFAGVDLGTNNCRLLIARPQGDGFRVVDSYSRVVQLGQGLSQSGRMAEATMDAAIEALSVCAAKMKQKSVKSWRCVATQACREAENGQAFVERVKAETGLRLEIISPRVESRLSVMGCQNLAMKDKQVALIVDIGGGSTELSWLDLRRLESADEVMRVHRPPISAWTSLPIGVVSIAERFPEHSDRRKWYDDMKSAVSEEIKKSGCETEFTQLFKRGQGHIIGTSGTVTSIAGIYLGLPYYKRDKIDGLSLPTRHALQIAADLSNKSYEERCKIPSIGEDRSQLLVGGCAIIDVICETWSCDTIRVADRGLREGILIGLMEQYRKSRKSSA